MGLSARLDTSAGLTTSKPLAEYSGVAVSHDTTYSATLKLGAMEFAAETCAVATGPAFDKHLLAAAATEAAHALFPTGSDGSAMPLDTYSSINTDGTVSHNACHKSSHTVHMEELLALRAVGAGAALSQTVARTLAPAGAAGAAALAAP